MTERDILFFFVSAFFAPPLAALFPSPFPEVLVLDPVFLRVYLRFDLRSGPGTVVDSESLSLAVVTRFL